MVELPIEIFTMAFFHLPIFVMVVLSLLALAVYAICLLLKRLLWWLSAFVETRLWPGRVPIGERPETWYARTAIEEMREIERRRRMQRM